jgi:hypothetical protein
MVNERTLLPHTAYGAEGEEITLIFEQGAEHIHIYHTDLREGREVVLENRGGDLQFLVYTADNDVPVVIRLPKSGGITIDRGDYDDSTIATFDLDNPPD